MKRIEEVLVPDMGDFDDVPVIEILVRTGQEVQEGDGLVTLESDKATMEVPSPASGQVAEVLVAIGDLVRTGSPLLQLAVHSAADIPVASETHVEQGASLERAPVLPGTSLPEGPSQHDEPIAALADEVRRSPPPFAIDLPHPLAPREKPPHASPSVRAFARELAVNLSEVSGSGRRGRISREDVQRYVQERLQQTRTPASGTGLDLPPWPEIDFERFGPIERVQLSRLRRISGPNLSRNWVRIPHVTNFDEADVTELEAFRRQVNQESGDGSSKLSLLAFLVRACAAALRAFPEFNSSLDGEYLVLKKYVHVGFAADTPLGLVVPVIRDADRKGVLEIGAEMAELASRARSGKLKPAEMQGGTFSISSLGSIGGTGFTPIINAPEVAILGVVRAQTKPVWDGEQFQPRLVLPLGLSWDHRAVDGAAAARFLVHLSGLLADFRRILL